MSFFTLLYITSQRPELGNGGLYYLSGNPVYGDALEKRAMLALLGYLICAIILYRKHRHMHSNIRFHHVILKFNLHNIVHLWQLRMAIGVSLILTAGQFFGVERFMWMGFACASLLSEYPYSDNVTPRFWQRIIGVFVGSGAFFDFSHHTRILSSTHGTVRRFMSWFLHRLSIQDSAQLLRRVNDGNRNLRHTRCRCSENRRYHFRCYFRNDIRFTVS